MLRRQIIAHSVYFSPIIVPLRVMERGCSLVMFRARLARVISLVLFVAALIPGLPAEAAERYIVRVPNGSAIQLVSLLTGFNVVEGIDGASGQLYLVEAPVGIGSTVGVSILMNTLGVLAVEPDLVARTADTAPAIPPA